MSRSHLRVISWYVTLALAGLASQASAGVTTDGTVGAAQVLAGPNYAITQALGQTVGSNLFHSFGTFSLVSGENATFSGAGISNIIARVTGGASSSIDGGIGSSIAGANLYLINPKGISFGPNASLNVSGSFHASTADYLLFANGRFDAFNPAATNITLATAAPTAFGFVSATPSSIATTGTTQLSNKQAGAAVSFIGGNVSLGRGIATKGGRIDIVSVASPGEVAFSSSGVTATGINGYGTINMTGSTTASTGSLSGPIYILGGNLVMSSATIASGSSGSSQGGDIRLDLTGTLTATNSSINTSNAISAGRSGGIVAQAGDINLTGSQIFTGSSRGSAGSGPLALNATNSIQLSGKTPGGSFGSISTVTNGGPGGNLTLSARTITVGNEALLTVGTNDLGGGNGGNLTIHAQDFRLIAGGVIASSLGSNIPGRGGDINISATNSLSIEGAVTSSAGSGTNAGAGDLIVSAPAVNVRGIISSTTNGAGNTGGINISGQRVIVNGALRLFTSGSGNAGTISVVADTFDLVGRTDNLPGINNIQFPNPGGISSVALNSNQGSLAISSSGSSGDAGLIVINAGKVNVTYGFISSVTNSFGNSGAIQIAANDLTVLSTGRYFPDLPPNVTDGVISTSARPGSTGNAGTVDITVGTMTLNQAVVSSGTSGSGNGGSINISAGALNVLGSRDPASMTQNVGNIIAFTRSSGAGGSVKINANDILVNAGQISSDSTSTGIAGSVAITAANSIQLVNGGVISARATQADGGNVTVNAKSRIYLSDSRISTAVGTGSGNGGNISIDPVFLILTDGSVISANAFGGNGGNINIVANNIFQSGDSSITASSQLGVSGSVTVSAPVVDLTGALAKLPSAYLDASALLAERCAARLAGKASSFVVAGRGGMPVEPSGLLPAAMLGVVALASNDESSPPGSFQLARADLGCLK